MDSFSRQKITFFTEAKALLFLLPLALVVRLIFLSRAGMPLPDEVYYVRSAIDILQGGQPGDFLDPINRGQPALTYLFAILTLLPVELLTAARLLSCLVASGTVVFVYFIAKHLADKRAAVISALLYAIAPWSLSYSLWAMNHALYNACWLALAWAGLEFLQSRRLLWIFLSAVFGWAAAMMRAEGVVLAGAAFLWIAILSKKNFMHYLLRVLLFFLALILPYWVYLHGVTGHWQITWVKGDAFDFFMQRKLSGGDSGVIALYMTRVMAVIKTLFHNPGYLGILGLVVLGSFSFFKISRKMLLLCFGLAAIPLFFYPAAGTELRYFHPAFLVLIPIAGVGLSGLLRLSMFSGCGMRGLLCVGVLVAFLPGYHSLWGAARDDRPQLKAAGSWLRANANRDSVIFGGDTRVCYYAGPACGRIITLQRHKAVFLSPEPLDFFRQYNVQWVIDDAPLQEHYYPAIFEKIRLLYQDGLFRREVVFPGSEGDITIYRVSQEI